MSGETDRVVSGRRYLVNGEWMGQEEKVTLVVFRSPLAFPSRLHLDMVPCLKVEQRAVRI